MLTEAYLLKKHGALISLEGAGQELHLAPGTILNKHARGELGFKITKHGQGYVVHYAELARYIDSIVDLA